MIERLVGCYNEGLRWLSYNPINKLNAGNWALLQSVTVFEPWVV